jgi:hypothetical protein
VFIVTPNVDGLEFKIAKKKLYCAGYSIPRHLTLFNHKSIEALVNQVVSLKTTDISSFFTIHHWVGLIHHWGFDMTKSDKVDTFVNYNNVFISLPLYVFELIRYRIGMQTGVMEVILEKR